MADLLPLNPNGFIDGSPVDPRTLPEVIDRANTHGRLTYIPIQARPEYYNYKNGLRIPFDKIPSRPVVGSYLPIPSEPTSPAVDRLNINDYRNMRATSSQMARTAPVNPRTYPVIETPRTYPVVETPRTYPVIESSRYLPTSPSKFGWLKAGVKKLGPVGAVLTSWDLSRGAGDYLNDKTGASDYWLGDAGKADLSELAGRTEIPNQGNLYNGEISDDEFNSMSHADKLKWLADRRHYRENANYVPASPTATNEYGEGKLPDGTMVHDGVTVAPTVPTVDTLIATANKPRVANRVANRTPVAPTTPTPTFNYGGSAPTYASSYNLNRDPNYQYSEAYAWRNNPAPAPAPTTWNNGWAKPNPRASSITNYYAGIGY